MVNPAARGDTSYSTADTEGAPRVDVVARFHCDRCGQAFPTEQELNVHRRTAHMPHR